MRQAAALRELAREVPDSTYALKLLTGAAELEAQAGILAAHPVESTSPKTRDALHAHVDITV